MAQKGPHWPNIAQTVPIAKIQKWPIQTTYLIFVTYITYGMCREKFVIWRGFRFLYAWQMWGNLKFLHMWKFFEDSPHDQCGEVSNFSISDICVMWKISPQMYKLCCFVQKSVLSQFTLFCREISFVAIYALLCGENFDHKLRMWRKYDKYEVCTAP